MTPEQVFSLIKGVIGYLVLLIGGGFAIKYSLKTTADKLEVHIDSDTLLFERMAGKLDEIGKGIKGITRSLGTHDIALALHDERAKRTADTLNHLVGKMDSLDEKVINLRVIVGNGRLDHEKGK